MNRQKAPTDFDWRGITADPPSTAYCSKCNSSFPTHHCLRSVGQPPELISYFTNNCPTCNSLDQVFGVRGPTESVTLNG